MLKLFRYFNNPFKTICIALALGPCLSLAVAALAPRWPWSCLVVTGSSGDLESWLTLLLSPDPLRPSFLGSSVVTQQTLCPEHTMTTKQHNCEMLHSCGWAGVRHSRETQCYRTATTCMQVLWTPFLQTTVLCCPAVPTVFWEDRQETKGGLQTQNYFVGPALCATMLHL